MTIPGIREVVETTLKWIDEHFSFRYFAIFFFLSIVFLFGINPILVYLGLPLMSPTYRVAAVACALIFGSGALIFAFETGWKRLVAWRDFRKHDASVREHLHSLPIDHITILRKYAESGKNSHQFYAGTGAICELERRGILYRASNIGSSTGLFAYNVTPVASKYLQLEEFQKILLNQRAQ